MVKLNLFSSSRAHETHLEPGIAASLQTKAELAPQRDTIASLEDNKTQAPNSWKILWRTVLEVFIKLFRLLFRQPLAEGCVNQPILGHDSLDLKDDPLNVKDDPLDLKDDLDLIDLSDEVATLAEQALSSVFGGDPKNKCAT